MKLYLTRDEIETYKVITTRNKSFINYNILEKTTILEILVNDNNLIKKINNKFNKCSEIKVFILSNYIFTNLVGRIESRIKYMNSGACYFTIKCKEVIK